MSILTERIQAVELPNLEEPIGYIRRVTDESGVDPTHYYGIFYDWSYSKGRKMGGGSYITGPLESIKEAEDQVRTRYYAGQVFNELSNLLVAVNQFHSHLTNLETGRPHPGTSLEFMEELRHVVSAAFGHIRLLYRLWTR